MPRTKKNTAKPRSDKQRSDKQRELWLLNGYRSLNPAAKVAIQVCVVALGAPTSESMRKSIRAESRKQDAREARRGAR